MACVCPPPAPQPDRDARVLWHRLRRFTRTAGRVSDCPRKRLKSKMTSFGSGAAHMLPTFRPPLACGLISDKSLGTKFGAVSVAFRPNSAQARPNLAQIGQLWQDVAAFGPTSVNMWPHLRPTSIDFGACAGCRPCGTSKCAVPACLPLSISTLSAHGQPSRISGVALQPLRCLASAFHGRLASAQGESSAAQVVDSRALAGTRAGTTVARCRAVSHALLRAISNTELRITGWLTACRPWPPMLGCI